MMPAAPAKYVRDPEFEANEVAHINRLRPQTVAALRASPPPRWLVRKVMHQKSLVLVWGAPGSGKTFLVLDLAACVERGMDWFGNRTQRTGVVYIAGEGHLKPRLDAYCEHHELGDCDLQSMRVLSTSVDLLDQGADITPLLAALQDTATELGGIGLVVLDTLNSAMPGGDENSSRDMGEIILAARKIMAALDCTVILVHHGGKVESSGARGHSSLKAAVDTEINVKNADGHRVASIEKQRDGEAGATFAFRLRSVNLGPSGDADAGPEEYESSCIVEAARGTSPTPKVKKLPKNSELAFRALREVIDEYGECLPETSAIPPGTLAVSGSAWRQRYYALDAMDPLADQDREREARKKRFDRARLGLQNASSIGAINDRYWIYA